MFSFGLFEFSWLIWLINVVFAVLAYFWSPAIGAFWVLFPAVFIFFVVMIRFSRKNSVGPEQIWENSAAWAKGIAIGSILYAAVNFAVCMTILGEGGPHIENGVYCLWNHGFIREITAAEYEAMLKVEARMFLGHILAFTGMPVAFFSARKNLAPLMRNCNYFDSKSC